ncbi:ABC transporter ATP-binding protein [Desulfoluna spongiiphila]|uniref:ABC transporter ATP-binding protein n=1 Tax=Desulfoluna spongiiphila TaxID=419481 RepID=UPI001257ECFF|nr:ATP-binding cassette domain-containing protein [Desulfoluna spongiiphila]VVS91568.1 abc transporter-like [Desulfoluna spongiiphila]
MIRVDDVTKDYGAFRAVDGISLEIRKGEILGLLGPNGAGKTTTLKMLTGYFPPTSGEIYYNDAPVSHQPLEIKKRIGYLPESAPLYPNMLVYDFLCYTADVRGIPKAKRLARIKEMSALCSLTEIMDKPIGELSKGLKQRVGLAYAMISDPEILVLDEPTSGLDPNQIVEIRKIIRDIGETRTIIFSTHILSEAEATCDRIAIVHKGKIVADGTTDEIRAGGNGSGPCLKMDVKGAPAAEAKNLFQGIGSVARVEASQSKENRCELSVTFKKGQDGREAVYNAVKETDWVLMNFAMEANTLETIFRTLTKEN